MIIGFDAKRYFNNRTGLGNYSRSVVEALLKNHPENQYTLFAPGQKGTVLPSGITIAETLRKGSIWRVFGMKKDLVRAGIQVYHGLTNEIPLGMNGSGVKTVVTIHDLIFKRFPGYYNFVDRWIYHLKTGYALRNADIVLAASETTANDIRLFYKKEQAKIKVVYQPVDAVWYEKPAASPVKSSYILYVSSFTQRKNHGSLIEAFVKIQKQTDLHLVLAGAEGETLEKCRSFVEAEKLTDRVHFFADCDFVTLHALVYGASLMVNCSFFEGFGIPLAEAAVCGRPMAVSDIAVFREIAGKAARYFNPNNSDEIASVMLESLAPEYQAEMEIGRGELLSKIDATAVAEQLNQIYRSLL